MARILIVDDAAFMRMSLRQILQGAGHEVVGEAEDGEKAVLEYRNLNPDVVTMDITMPEMDGITALKKIVASDPSAKVVMCSAMGQSTMVKESILAGAKHFIVKPFKKEGVIEIIGKVASL